jgi:hypothetical protein
VDLYDEVDLIPFDKPTSFFRQPMTRSRMAALAGRGSSAAPDHASRQRAEPGG